MKKVVKILIILTLFSLGMNTVGIIHAKPIELNVACIVAAGGSEERALEYFKQKVEEQSDGEIEVNLFLGAILGDERTVFEQLTVGETAISLGGEMVVTTYAPELYVFGVPFLFTKKQVRDAITGELGERMKKAVLERANIVVLGFSLRGPRQLMTVNKKIVEPEDVKGLKLRLPPIEDWITAWKQLGALPTPVAAAEQFTALQMGLVEATENPISPLYALRFHELCKYLMLTDHLYSFRAWSMSKLFLDRLKEAHQQIVLACATEAVEYLTSIEEEFEQELLIDMQKAGVQLVTPNKKAFRNAVLPAIEEIKKSWAPGLYEEYIVPLLQ